MKRLMNFLSKLNILLIFIVVSSLVINYFYGTYKYNNYESVRGSFGNYYLGVLEKTKKKEFIGSIGIDVEEGLSIYSNDKKREYNFLTLRDKGNNRLIGAYHLIMNNEDIGKYSLYKAIVIKDSGTSLVSLGNISEFLRLNYSNTYVSDYDIRIETLSESQYTSLLPIYLFSKGVFASVIVILIVNSIGLLCLNVYIGKKYPKKKKSHQSKTKSNNRKKR